MTEVQQKLYHMLKWYHDFCTQYGLTYYILGGTLLGAIRHQGFIPWDDDIDIGMPRPDYEKFLLLTRNLSSIYTVEAFDSPDPLFTYPFTKLYDTSTTYIEKGTYQLRRGLYIDVFPLDGMEKYPLKKYMSYFLIHTMKSSQSICRHLKVKQRPLYKRIVIYIVRNWFSTLFLSKRYTILLNKICKRHAFGKTLCAGNLLGAWGIKEIVPIEYFGSPKKYTFEDITVFGPEKGEKYLKAIYGDYMTLPPKEKRISDHEFILCDLHKSYLEK